ncbi:Uncharacterized protein PBTT_09758 [Plasmodiophora brassicae]
MMQRAGDAASSLPGTVGAASFVTVSPGAYVYPAAATHLATASNTIVLASWVRDGCDGRSGRVLCVAPLGPAGGAVTIGVGGIAFLLNVLLVTAAGAVGAVRLGGRSALLLVLGVHRMLLVVLLLVDTGLGGG